MLSRKPNINYYNPEGSYTENDVDILRNVIKQNIPSSTRLSVTPEISSNPVVSSTPPMALPTTPNMPAMTPSPMGSPMPPPQPEQDDSSNFLGSLIAQGVAGIGTGLMGGSASDIQRSAGMFDSMRSQQASRDRAKLLMDPKSEESRKKREVYKSLGYQVKDNLSATDLNDPTVLQTLKSQMEQSRLASMPKQGGGVGGVGKQQGIEKSPFFKDIVLTNNMSRSVERDLKELIGLVERSGNTPLMGADKFRKDQLVGKIAINYNKILDPSSVVKGEESQAVVQLLGLDWMTRDNVTKESLQQFQKGVGEEANDRIKGYYGMYTTFDPTEQQIYDDYRKNPNDTKLKQAFENILYLKRTK
jgi:hypothetical protein